MAHCWRAQCLPSKAPPSLPREELTQQQQQRTVQQPYNNAPIWKEVRGAVQGYASIPAPEAGVLIQDGGQNWRALRNGKVSVIGGWALVVMALVVAAVLHVARHDPVA